jgi:maltose O-acetyltransferase
VFVMKLTGMLPDLTPIMKMQGWLLKPCFVSCGRNLQIASNAMMVYTNNVHIGKDVYIAYGCWIQAGGSISIEDEVLIGPYVVVIAGDHGYRNGSYRYTMGHRAPILLKRGCWIGAHATVLKGVTIGKGAMLAANAVANRDVPDHSIAGGVPARVLRHDVREIAGHAE